MFTGYLITSFIEEFELFDKFTGLLSYCRILLLSNDCGVGEKAKGWSVSLVSAAPEEMNHKSICPAILVHGSSSFDVAPMDSRLFSNAQERAKLASKIVA